MVAKISGYGNARKIRSVSFVIIPYYFYSYIKIELVFFISRIDIAFRPLGTDPELIENIREIFHDRCPWSNVSPHPPVLRQEIHIVISRTS